MSIGVVTPYQKTAQDLARQEAMRLIKEKNQQIAAAIASKNSSTEQSASENSSTAQGGSGNSSTAQGGSNLYSSETSIKDFLPWIIGGAAVLLVGVFLVGNNKKRK